MNDMRVVELNAVGALKRREIEARLLAPLVEALSQEFGREEVLQNVRETIVRAESVLARCGPPAPQFFRRIQESATCGAKF